MKIGENEYQEPITWQPDTNTMSFQLFDGNGELVRACDAADALNELAVLRETVKKLAILIKVEREMDQAFYTDHILCDRLRNLRDKLIGDNGVIGSLSDPAVQAEIEKVRNER